jgi:pullulanase/glycogen debranching enzyme
MLFLSLLLLIPGVLQGQPNVRGFEFVPDSAVFVFSESVYGVKPARVFVAGGFNGWSVNPAESKFQLKPSAPGTWRLALANKDLRAIPKGSEYKFVIDDGKWMDPPAVASNIKNGNLEFLHGVTPPSLKAEFKKTGNIWVVLEGVERSLDPKSYRLTNAKGKEIPVASILPNDARQALLKTAVPVDIRRVYYLEVPAHKLKTMVSFDGWFREVYSAKPLGANVENRSINASEASITVAWRKTSPSAHTAIRLFAPRADSVRVFFYNGKDDTSEFASARMKIDSDYVWEVIVPDDLHGIWYDFAVYGPDEPGNHFFQKTGVKVTDPYARVTDDGWGKGRIWRATKPAAKLKGGIPSMKDVVAYEVHVQDFTDLLPVPENQKGTIPAFTKPGLKNKAGAKIGFDYLVDLGINTVHLLPVQEFIHYKDSLWKPVFENDPQMKRLAIANENYQWGYRTTHAFAVESRYRQKGTEPGAERDQFRDLVQAFHDKGIAVIIDIVPNHTGENIDKGFKQHILNWNGIDKVYHYRTRNGEHLGEYGNEVKTENRPMVQRWLIDQCLHFINEFGIDGFRVDLAGQIDQQTLIALKKAIGEDKIVYGEPWIGSNDPEYEANPDWDWYKIDAPITFFQDDSRDAYKGTVFHITWDVKKRGFAGGDVSARSKVVTSLQSYWPEEKKPTDGIKYLDIHDNWALADQFADNADLDGRKGVYENRVKLAAALLFTSQGPVVVHGGTEMLRSKGLTENADFVKNLKDGTPVQFKGRGDTYNQRASNWFLWENAGQTKNAAAGFNSDFKGQFAFWKGLMEFRKSKYGQVFRNSERLPEGYYQFIAPENEGLLGYVVNGSVAVFMNAGDKADAFKNVTLPAGKWKLVGNINGVNTAGVKDDAKLMKIDGGKAFDLNLSGADLKIWVKE